MNKKIKSNSFRMSNERRVHSFGMNKERRIHLMMNKRAGLVDIVMKSAVGLILVAMFTVGMFWFMGNQKNATSMWGESYSKEIARVIDLAKPGDVIRLDVQKATQVARANGISDLNEIFRFDNINKMVYVKLSNNNVYGYPFFSNSIIVGDKLELAVPGNILSFKVAKASGTAGGTA